MSSTHISIVIVVHSSWRLQSMPSFGTQCVLVLTVLQKVFSSFD